MPEDKTKRVPLVEMRDMQLALQDAMSATNAYNQPGRKRRPYLPLSAPPLKLPAGKYDIWKSMTLYVNPKEMFGT